VLDGGLESRYPSGAFGDGYGGGWGHYDKRDRRGDPLRR
jgi:hypothetical protein